MLVRALRRPAVTAAVGLAVVATTAAGYQASDRHQTEQAGFTVSAQAIEQANEQSDLQIENDAQLASARSDANASAAALQEKDRRDRLAAEAAAARAPSGGRGARRPREGAQGPGGKARRHHRRRQGRPPCSGPGAPARVRLGRQPVLLPRQPLGGRERLELPGREPSSGAYGIPQSLPGSKMASVAPTGANPVTQITWGLRAHREPHGSPVVPGTVAEPQPALVLRRRAS